MHPQLEAIARELDDATRRAEAVVSRGGDEGLKKRPPGGGWSAAECIEHLILTSRAVLPQLDEALANKRSTRLPARIRCNLIGWLVWLAVRPSMKMKAKTSPDFTPGTDRPADEILAEFRELQAGLLERLQRSDGLAIDRIMIASPFNERLRYTVYSAFTIVAAHEHRHLEQAERALAASGA